MAKHWLQILTTMEKEWSKTDKLTQPVQTEELSPSVGGKVSAKAVEINNR